MNRRNLCSQCQDAALQQGVGGGHAARARQQRVVRHVPRAPGHHRLQLRGQEHSRVGHVQAYG